MNKKTKRISLVAKTFVNEGARGVLFLYKSLL